MRPLHSSARRANLTKFIWSALVRNRRDERPLVPRFFFHLYDDGEAPDLEGCDLPDLDAAIEDAFREARHLAGHLLISDGTLYLSHRIEISDETGAVLATIRFRDIVRVVG